MGDLFFVNTFTQLGSHLYIVASFYKTVNNDLCPLRCYHGSVEHGWGVVEKYTNGHDSDTILNKRDMRSKFRYTMLYEMVKKL